MRKFYLAFPILVTASPKLTWSHYFELLKCDNSLEMQFYYKECIKEGWKVREPCRILLPVSYNIQFILFAKIVPVSSMKACFQIAQHCLTTAKINLIFVTSKLLGCFLRKYSLNCFCGQEALCFLLLLKKLSRNPRFALKSSSYLKLQQLYWKICIKQFNL